MLPVASEMVNWKTNLSVDILLAVVIGMQVNFGLEISMNDTNYFRISLQHSPFRIDTLC